MRYNISHGSYRTPEENEKLTKKETKLTSNLNELGHVTCPQCRKKLVRVFAPRSGRTPVFHGDVKDYMRRMRKTMATCESRGAKSECHVSGPKYTIVYNANHFTKPYADNLGIGRGYGYCGCGCFLGYSAIDVVSRLLLRHRMIRRACIANHVKPQEVRDWLATVDVKKLDGILGYGFGLEQIANTDLWAGTYSFNGLHANTIDYNVKEVAGPEWAAETDPIIADPPPTKGYRGKYTMSPTHGAVQYSTNRDRCDIAIDLPAGINYANLVIMNWNRIVNVRTQTGVLAKIIVTHESASAKSINNMTHALHNLNTPRKFWVIQPTAYCGSTRIETGDITL